MRIIIDARWIFPEISGIGLYTVELIRALTALDSENNYTLLFDNEAVKERVSSNLDLDSVPNFKTEIFPCGVFSLKSQLTLPLYLKKQKADVFHSANYMIPMAAFPRHRKGKTGCVITIHDLIPLLFPAHAPKSKKTRMMPLYRFVMKQVSARADAILTVSENSASDIRRLLLPKSTEYAKVAAAYNGVSDEFRKLEWAPSHNPQNLLYVGRLDPYKNVTALIRIFNEVRKQASNDVKLVIAGSRDPRYPEAQELCRTLKLDDHVEWTGYIDPGKLYEVYSKAAVLVHPARYEGFGLPVAEAMAAGLPVVCSNGGSLAEIAGDAACVHDYNDENAFIESICGILNSTARAKELSMLGRKRADAFTWAKAAVKTLDIYRKVAGK